MEGDRDRVVTEGLLVVVWRRGCDGDGRSEQGEEERDVRREERDTRGPILIEQRVKRCWDHREDGKDENIEIRNRRTIG